MLYFWKRFWNSPFLSALLCVLENTSNHYAFSNENVLVWSAPSRDKVWWHYCTTWPGTGVPYLVTQMWFVFHLRGDYWRMVQQQHLILLQIITMLLWLSVTLLVSYFCLTLVYLLSHVALAGFVWLMALFELASLKHIAEQLDRLFARSERFTILNKLF